MQGVGGQHFPDGIGRRTTAKPYDSVSATEDTTASETGVIADSNDRDTVPRSDIEQVGEIREPNTGGRFRLVLRFRKGVIVTDLMAPMTEDLVWANVMRPRIPLVYLDLNTIIYIARALRGDTNVPRGYAELYEAALLAKAEQRAMFPLSGQHLWEILKITDPKQRGVLADILEALSDYNYLLGRTVIAELEFEAGMAKIMGEDSSARSFALVRPTFGQEFGFVGGMRIRNCAGGDGSDAVRAQMTDAEFYTLMATMNYQMEHQMLRGPSDEDLAALRTDPSYRPEAAMESQRERLLQELDTVRVLNEHPKWRRGRLRDAIGAREFAHEWIDMFTRMRVDRGRSGMPAFNPSDDQMRAFMGSMPHTQVAISVKTIYHKNPLHKWTVNDIVDIDAMSVAYAYCEAVFPDKAMRAALQHSKELRTIETFLPRRPIELTEWLTALPKVSAPDLWLPHPLPRSVADHALRQ